MPYLFCSRRWLKLSTIWRRTCRRIGMRNKQCNCSCHQQSEASTSVKYSVMSCICGWRIGWASSNASGCSICAINGLGDTFKSIRRRTGEFCPDTNPEVELLRTAPPTSQNTISPPNRVGILRRKKIEKRQEKRRRIRRISGFFDPNSVLILSLDVACTHHVCKPEKSQNKVRMD